MEYLEAARRCPPRLRVVGCCFLNWTRPKFRYAPLCPGSHFPLAAMRVELPLFPLRMHMVLLHVRSARHCYSLAFTFLLRPLAHWFIEPTSSTIVLCI